MADYKLDTRILDGMLKNLEGNMERAVAKAGFMVEGRAKIKAPVDTGALRASIYTSMQRTDNSTTAEAAALVRRPEAEIVALPVPKDTHTVHVGPSVEYAEAVELGSARRSGTPYLLPAFRETEEDMRALIIQAIRGSGGLL